MRSDPRQALGLVDHGLLVLESTDDVVGRAHLFALGLRAAADLAAWALARRDAGGASEATVAATRHGMGLHAIEAGELIEGAARDGRVAARVGWGRAEDGRRCGLTDPEVRDWWYEEKGRARGPPFDRLDDLRYSDTCHSATLGWSFSWGPT